MTTPDPKVVLRAHALRAEATRRALLHGRTTPRSSRGNKALLVSIAIAAAIAVVIIVVGRISAVLHH